MSRPIPARGVSALSRTLALTCLATWTPASTGTAQESPPVQKPLPEHKVLAAEEGAWDATIRMYEKGPDAEPSVSKGSEVNEVARGLAVGEDKVVEAHVTS